MTEQKILEEYVRETLEREKATIQGQLNWVNNALTQLQVKDIGGFEKPQFQNSLRRTLTRFPSEMRVIQSPL
ncbi:MAG: hypothetical protein AABX16_04420 [Nanoarchaeota archaeon]